MFSVGEYEKCKHLRDSLEVRKRRDRLETFLCWEPD